MILPALFIVVTLIYYTGIWDKVIHPLFPRHVDKIQTAAGYRLDDKTLEDFYVINEYTGSDKDVIAIDNYAHKQFSVLSRECPGCMKMNVSYYFVPRELYDPIDNAASKDSAVSVYRHMGTEGSATIERIAR